MQWGKSDKRVVQIDRVLRAYLMRVAEKRECSSFDPNLASAYLEENLSTSDRERFEQHLVLCAVCRTAVVKLSRNTRLLQHKPLPFQLEAPAPPNPWAPRFAYALAASVLLAAGFLATTRSLWWNSLRPSPPRATKSIGPGAGSAGAASSAFRGRRVRPERPAEKKSPAVLASFVQPIATPAPPILDSVTAAPSLLLQPESTGRVSGFVTGRDNEVLPSVTVSLVDIASGAARSSMTDADGRFHFNSVPAGRYILSGAVGGEQFSKTVEVAPDRESLAQFHASSPLPLAAIPPARAKSEVADVSESSRLETARVSDISSAGTAVQDLGRLRTGVGLVGSPLQELQGGSKSTSEIGFIQRTPFAFPAASRDRRLELADGDARSLLKEEIRKTKRVGAKVFQFENGIWVDREFLTGSRYPLVQFTAKSPELKAQTKNDFVLKEYLRVGRNVIVVYEKKVIAVMER